MKIILASLFLLSACAAPATIYKPVDDSAPVFCKIQPIQKPKLATESITEKNTLVEQVRALVVTEKQRDGYETLLESAVKSCQ